MYFIVIIIMWHELLFCVYRYRSEIISVKMRTYKRRVGARKYADYLDENLQKAVVSEWVVS